MDKFRTPLLLKSDIYPRPESQENASFLPKCGIMVGIWIGDHLLEGCCLWKTKSLQDPQQKYQWIQKWLFAGHRYGTATNYITRGQNPVKGCWANCRMLDKLGFFSHVQASNSPVHFRHLLRNIMVLA